jgi:flagellar hook-associated protein 1 FlgK
LKASISRNSNPWLPIGKSLYSTASIHAVNKNQMTGPTTGMRDGLGTGAVPGPVGDATRINALGSALAAPREPASGDFSGGALSATGLAAEMLSLNGTARQTAEADETFASFMATTYDTRVLEIGVDTDVELQNLMVVETAYAANAQVLRTIDEMLKTVLAI